MRQIRSQTKVIATIGPTSSTKEVLEKMFHEGIDVCRLNFSHGTHEDHLHVINTVLELNEELNTNVALLADLQGPKIRIGDVENNRVELIEGNTVAFVTEKCLGTADKLYLSYKEFPKDVKEGDFILIDDGKFKLEVTETNRKDKVKAKVIHGGFLSSKKGVNLPNTKISLPSLTEKDIEDVNFALDNNVDWIALSFVRSADDLVQLKEIIRNKKKFARIIAKIEKPEALEDIDNIIDASNGIMVARGDLGVEIPFDQVPLIQKDLVKRCVEKAKPVIIATQMLESMITNFRPTRAEANDVANAVLDGADTVMLSAETSAGKYPVESVAAMQKIIDWTEKGVTYNRETLPIANSRTFLPDSICLNACRMASQTDASAIITFTYSGYTAFKISSHRPNSDIFVFTRNTTLLRKMSLVWGVRAFILEEHDNIDDAIKYSMDFLKERNLIKEGEVVVHVGSTPYEDKGQTNIVKLSYV
ncbi:MAG TPA: pyruvate kinase [Bacteroidales bacterium]|nr:pyruvate kinase [Bacteroidales bacterium]